VGITFDPEKNARNIRERNLSFGRVEDLTALIRVDDRRDYGEQRFRALGFLDGRPQALVFTERGEDIRVITLRKANRTEMRRYGKLEG